MLRSVVSWGGIAVPRGARLELGGISRERRCERESCCLISGSSPVHDLRCSASGRRFGGTYDLPTMNSVHEGAPGAQARYSHDLSCRVPQAACDAKSWVSRGGSMRGMYQSLPPARSVEQAIILAQLLIARDLEHRAAIPTQEVQAGAERGTKAGDIS